MRKEHSVQSEDVQTENKDGRRRRESADGGDRLPNYRGSDREKQMRKDTKNLRIYTRGDREIWLYDMKIMGFTHGSRP